MAQNLPDDSARLRRILPERAIALAMQSRWGEAVEVNRAILAIEPNDADAYNRLGKAQLELGNYREAYEAYKRAVELAPGNAIAQKNMNWLAPLAQQATAAPARRPGVRPVDRVTPHTFIEETGKTGLANLINLASGTKLHALTAGDSLELVVRENHLEVHSDEGEYLGEVEPRVAQRLVRFMEAGNRYSAAVTTVSDKSLSVIIRERFQAPAMVGRLSFPAKGPVATYRAVGSSARYNYDDDEDSGEFESEGEAELEAEELDEEGEYEDDEIDERE